MSKDMKLIMERFRKSLVELGMHDAGANVAHIGQAPDELEAQKVDPKELLPALKKMLSPLIEGGLNILKGAGIGIKAFLDIIMDGIGDAVKGMIRSIDDSTYGAFSTALMLIGGSAAGIGTGFLAASAIPFAGAAMVILAVAAGMSTFLGGMATIDTITSDLHDLSKSDSRRAAEARLNKRLKQGAISLQKHFDERRVLDILDQHTPVGGKIPTKGTAYSDGRLGTDRQGRLVVSKNQGVAIPPGYGDN
jgi:hypothetical protein